MNLQSWFKLKRCKRKIIDEVINGQDIIMGSCRTPIGNMGGAMSSLSAVEFGAVEIKNTREMMQR